MQPRQELLHLHKIIRHVFVRIVYFLCFKTRRRAVWGAGMFSRIDGLKIFLTSSERSSCCAKFVTLVLQLFKTSGPAEKHCRVFRAINTKGLRAMSRLVQKTLSTLAAIENRKIYKVCHHDCGEAVGHFPLTCR